MLALDCTEARAGEVALADESSSLAYEEALRVRLQSRDVPVRDKAWRQPKAKAVAC